MDVPHRVFAQPWVFRTFRAVTAKAPSLRQKISHLLCGQFREWYIPQSGENVVFEDVAICCVCGRTALVLVVDLL